MSPSSEKKLRERRSPLKKTRAFFKKKSSSCSREAFARLLANELNRSSPPHCNLAGFIERLVFERNAFFLVSYRFYSILSKWNNNNKKKRRATKIILLFSSSFCPLFSTFVDILHPANQRERERREKREEREREAEGEGEREGGREREPGRERERGRESQGGDVRLGEFLRAGRGQDDDGRLNRRELESRRRRRQVHRTPRDLQNPQAEQRVLVRRVVPKRLHPSLHNPRKVSNTHTHTHTDTERERGSDFGPFLGFEREGVGRGKV